MFLQCHRQLVSITGHWPRTKCLASLYRQFLMKSHVPLHNGNQYPPIPTGHSVHIKQNYENVKIILETIDNRYKMAGILRFYNE